MLGGNGMESTGPLERYPWQEPGWNESVRELKKQMKHEILEEKKDLKFLRQMRLEMERK